ncbi:FAD:protein FMN transferase ApbE [Pseudodesulfovibrio cashew]|uniref:FAD:protein FMN transferase n=1 Tax=Pseudodesulfovibrio cashew TaxID=2678688 RepID=A0A6I6JGP8_9BACT|nr:FAD:protein FMN transferase [Pseudodesulfovibrio cashew]QGY42035.1 FAD:protein FMN transferase ApbE [Pseudodesulfovibrio cashew]
MASLNAYAGLLVLLLLASGCANDPQPVRFQGKALGTTYSIVAYGLHDGLTSDAVYKGIGQEVAGVNAAMSLFDPDSELSRFNAYDKTDWFPVSRRLAQVAEVARQVHLMTGGAFDITIAPLVDLWGFGKAQRVDVVPPEQAIATAMALVGEDRIEVRLDPPALRKGDPKMSLDLGAIAKGYCVDAVGDWLDSQGVTSFMVEIGGEIRTRGKKPDGSLWRIAVEKPVTMERSVQAIISFTDKAMATSGDYRNYFEEDGIRYSHILDPTTGRPISHSLVSVSVMDDTCARADALATGLMVLGPKRGIEVAKRENLSAFFLVKTADGFAETATGDFPQHETLK